MGTSTGIALPRTGIGNLRVWVPTYISCMFEMRGEEKEKEDGWGGRMEITPYYTDNTDYASLIQLGASPLKTFAFSLWDPPKLPALQ